MLNARTSEAGLIALAVLLLVPSNLLSQVRVSFESRVSPSGDGEVAITNQGKFPIVAWILEILREPCNPIEANRHTYAGYDSVTSPGVAAIQPLKSRIQDIGASNCNKAGTHTPNRASLELALFADGSSVGNPTWLGILRKDRMFLSQRIDRVIRSLRETSCTRKREQCVASLEKAREALPPTGEPHVQYPAPDPFDTAILELNGNRSAPLGTQIATLLSQLQAERDRLSKQP
jgi:hypothetical protein